MEHLLEDSERDAAGLKRSWGLLTTTSTRIAPAQMLALVEVATVHSSLFLCISPFGPFEGRFIAQTSPARRVFSLDLWTQLAMARPWLSSSGAFWLRCPCWSRCSLQAGYIILLLNADLEFDWIQLEDLLTFYADMCSP